MLQCLHLGAENASELGDIDVRRIDNPACA
jgi:hypothetical protein